MKGFRFAEPASLAIGCSEATELNHAGFVRVERQLKLPEPVAHRINKATCVALLLKADDQIIGVANDDHVAVGFLPSPAFGPEIEAVV